MRRISAHLHIQNDREAISNLQNALDLLGFSIESGEIRERVYGSTTQKAVQQFQRRMQLPETDGMVGPRTADRLNAALEEQGAISQDGHFVVRGVVTRRKQPVAGLLIRAFDQDLPSKKIPRQILGESPTDEAGAYTISYLPPQFNNAEKMSADIVLTVTDATGKVLLETPVHYNSPALQIVNIELVSADTADPEFDLYIADLKPLLEEVGIHLLTEHDIEFLSKETDINPAHLEYLSQAHQRSRDTKEQVPPDIFYALFRAGFPPDIALWYNIKIAEIRNTLLQSISAIIAERNRSWIERSLPLLQNYIILEAHSSPLGDQQPQPGEIIGVAIEGTDKQVRFLERYNANTLPIEEFWKQLAETTEFKNDVPRIQLTLQLSSLTLNNVTLIKVLQQQAGITGMRQLADWDDGHWKDFISSNKIPVPAFIEGADAGEKLSNYIRVVTTVLENAFPTVFINKQVRQQPAIDFNILRKLKKLNETTPDMLASSFDELNLEGLNESELLTARQAFGTLKEEINAYPAFKTQLEKSDVFSSDTQVVKNLVRDNLDVFFRNAADFDISQHPVDVYLRQKGDTVFQGVEEKEAVSQQLRGMQRVYNITTDVKNMQVLMNAGLQSARDIATMPFDRLLELTSGKLEDATAMMLYSKAGQISSTTQMMYQSMYELNQMVAPHVSVFHDPVIEDALKATPDYETLFGSLDTCDCADCKSVYSAAAYFVELLHVVLDGKHNGPAIKALFKRRPDLQYIRLTCENTHTPIPYIDLVLEILETYVAFGALSKAYTRDTSAFTSEELAANPQFIIRAAYDKVKNALYPLNLPFDIDLATIRVYLEHLESSRYTIMQHFRNDELAATHLGAAAEYLNLSETEYEIITGSKLDGSSSTLITSYAALFGFTNADLTPILKLGDEGKAVIILQKLLNRKGASPVLIVDGKFGPQTRNAVMNFQALMAQPQTGVVTPALWPLLLTEDTLLGEHLAFAGDFLHITSITYDDLIALLNTAFLNPHSNIARYLQDPEVPDEEKDAYMAANPGTAELLEKVIVLAAPDKAPCDLEKTMLLHLDGTALSNEELAQFNRFIRLWKKLGITIQDTDLLITTFNSSTINPEAIWQISKAVALQRDLQLPYEKLLSLWTSINTRYDNGLYQQLFMNRTALKLDEKLGLNGIRTELQTLTEKIDDHTPALLAAFRIAEEDLAIIRKDAMLDQPADLVNLSSLSTLYRYVVLAKALRLKIPQLITLKRLSGIQIFNNPYETAAFAELATAIKEAGFKIPVLAYLYSHVTDASTTGIPSSESITNMARSIRDGLLKIDTDTTLPSGDDDASTPVFTAELLQSKLSMLFETAVVSKTTAMLDLAETSTYSPVEAQQWLQEVYYAFLSSPDITTILAETSRENRVRIFLEKSLPYLREQLSNMFIRQTVAAALKVDTEVITLLMETVLSSPYQAGKRVNADVLALRTRGLDGDYFDNKDLLSSVNSFHRIDPAIRFDWQSDSPDPAKLPADQFSVRWSGKLLCPSTDEYTFYARTDDGVRLWINDQLIIDQWNNQPLTEHIGKIALKAGTVYNIRMDYFDNSGAATATLYWSSPVMAKSVISADSLMPESLVQQFGNVFLLLHKCAVLINTLSLTAGEIAYFSAHPADFDGFDLNQLPINIPAVYNPAIFASLPRLISYRNMRNQLPAPQLSWLDVFRQADGPFPVLFDTLLAVSGWNETDLRFLLGTDYNNGYFKAAASDFKNEKLLVKLGLALETARQMGIAAEKITGWKALSVTEQMASDIKNTVRAKYEEEQWLDISPTLSNKLRTRQRDALVAYLMATEKIASVSSLYEYFLIDFEMGSCMITSRLKQAISSTQLFVQRCLLNIEKSVSAGVINATQWKWMKNYRVWEANRKVFLYPENWIEPELRDNKSPFFRELESELLQNEVTSENVETALMHYLQKLDEVARLDICGMYVDNDTKEVHIVGKTFTGPYVFYYRKRTTDQVWTPWEKIQVDIQVAEDNENTGVHVIPVMWNRRLYLFWPVFTHKDEAATPEQKQSGMEANKYWEIRMSWTEYRQGKWTAKKTTSPYVKAPQAFIFPTNHPAYYHSFVMSKSGSDLIIQVFRGFEALDLVSRMGYFVFSGCNDRVFVSSSKETGFDKMAYTVKTSRQYYQTSQSKSNNHALTFKDMTKNSLDVLGGTNGIFQVLKSSDEFSAKKNTQYHYYSFCYQDKSRNYYVEPVQVPIISRIVAGIKNVSQTTFGMPDVVVATKTSLGGIIGPDPVENVIPRGAGNLATAALSRSGTAGAAMTMTMKRQSYYSYGIQELATANQFDYLNDYIGIYTIPTETKLRFHPFFHAYVCPYMKSLNMNGIPGLLTITNQKNDDNGSNFKSYDPKKIVDKNYPAQHVDFSGTGAYSIYNWELFFHIPVLLANRLSKNRQFESAQDWYHYIFDPTTNSTEAVPARYWNVLPFKQVKIETIQELLQQLQLPASDPKRKELETAITQWRNNPFNPHLIARMRLIAYEKNVVMKYIENLIAWADQLFSQDTIESINEATQLYLLAAGILGERPPHIPARGKIEPQSYSTLRPKLDAFSNALVQMETIFPFYSTDDIPLNLDNPSQQLGSSVSVPYFCVPDNDKLLGYWDTVADRLFKIRHCQNIEGVERQLALFEPPIDPALLVQAAAKGIDISSVLNDLNTPKPYYRFSYLVQKAQELCNELKTLGASLLGAIEKKDMEAITAIRSNQETSILNLLKEVKKLQIQETLRNREGLEKTREVLQLKFDYYKQLVENGLSSEEDENLVQSTIGFLATITSQFMEMAAASAHPLPDVSVGGAGAMGSPLNANTVAGGSKAGAALSASGRFSGMIATMANFGASRALTMAGYSRRSQEWGHQQKTAEKELKQTDKQILAAQIREDIAYKELDNQEKQIENARYIEEFLRNKYTNEELYGWLQGEIATIYFQCYQMTYDLAKKAENAFRFERGLTSSNFIQFGNWDSMRKGLLAGERLSLSLRQMEKAYLDQHAREYELVKTISLLGLQPLALVQLKETGTCEVEIPELLFDMDYPGHYMRRIKTVNLSIPCIVGPYSNVNCTLTLLGSRIRIKNTASGQYQEKTEEEDNRFTHNFSAMQSIATSSAQNDNGMFEMSFRDERYLPFEGAGAVSHWRIDMPQQNNAFDMSTISDVLIRLSYTAREGGKQLKQAANTYRDNIFKDAENSPLIRMFHMRHEFPNEWHQFSINASPQPELIFGLDSNRFPFTLAGKKITVTVVEIFIRNGKAITGATVVSASGESKNITLAKMTNATDVYNGKDTFSELVTADNTWKIVVNKADILGKPEIFLVVHYTIS